MAQDAKESNADRAARAEQVVRHYSRIPGYSGEADYEADITDLLTDLRHFCAGARLDFDEMVRKSAHHCADEGKEVPGKRTTRSSTKEPVCPGCGARLEYEPDQDGACDWHCPKCGWYQHVPPMRRAQVNAERKEEPCRTRRNRQR